MRWIVGLIAAAALGLAIVLALLPDVIFPPRGKRSRANHACRQLKTLTTAQSLYRESGKGSPADSSSFTYAGSLAELGSAAYIDSLLASGLKLGYRFRMIRSAENPQSQWLAVATPTAKIPKDERRFFAVNQSGVVHYDTTPIPLRSDCQIWSRARPVGK